MAKTDHKKRFTSVLAKFGGKDIKIKILQSEIEHADNFRIMKITHNLNVCKFMFPKTTDHITSFI